MKYARFLSTDPDLSISVMEAPVLRGAGVHNLPPGAPIVGGKVDDYLGCPAHWPRSSGITSSYFIPVKENTGMWLNFNAVAQHKHHVAVVVSIQGINPITGRKADKLELEKYPKDESVEKWLRGKQNFLATTSTPGGHMWIDGFRAADGTTRQYVFTSDSSKGVAAQLIGVDRVFAIGVGFFLSKQPKPEQPRGGRRMSGLSMGGNVEGYGYYSKGVWGVEGPQGPQGPQGILWAKGLSKELDLSSVESSAYLSAADSVSYCANDVQASTSKGLIGCNMMRSAVTLKDQIEIAAGAEIDQQIHGDPNELSFWNSEPAGIVVINYASVADYAAILQAGKDEGFLNGLKVGN